MKNRLTGALIPATQLECSIDGPAGALEVIVSAPKVETISGICVVCHPHPLYGGTMTNKVVWTLASAALKAGFVVARFNFRGVGHSEGTYDHAIGETEDALTIVAALQRIYPGVPLLLAGFSFGAYVSLKAATLTQPAALISIAPPFGRYIDAAEPPPQPQCPWLAVHSVDDDVVAFSDTKAILDAYPAPPEFVRFENAGHFFHGQLGELQAAVSAFLHHHFGAV